MEPEILLQADESPRRVGRLRDFLTFSIATASVLSLGGYAILYVAGVTLQQVKEYWRTSWDEPVLLGLVVLTIWGYWLCKLILGKLAENYSARLVMVRRVYLTLSICCFLAFAVFAVVGIRRGYSIQSNWPFVFFFEGMFLLAAGSWSTHKFTLINVPFMIVMLLCSFPLKGKEWFALLYVLLIAVTIVLYWTAVAGRFTAKRRQWILSVSWIVFIAAFIIWIATTSPIRHRLTGQSYYRERLFEEALKEFEAEKRDWSKHILYEPYEDAMLMTMLAKTYCQLGRFEEARRTYELLGERYVNKWTDDVPRYLKELDDGLAIAKRYEAWVEGSGEFPYDLDDSLYVTDAESRKYFILSDVAQAYRYDLSCDRKALEIYRRMMELDVSGLNKEWLKKDIEMLEKQVEGLSATE